MNMFISAVVVMLVTATGTVKADEPVQTQVVTKQMQELDLMFSDIEDKLQTFKIVTKKK